jgi:hypothetical protein
VNFYRWDARSREPWTLWQRWRNAAFQRLFGGFGHCNATFRGVVYDCSRRDGCRRSLEWQYPLLPDATIRLVRPQLDFRDWKAERRYDGRGTIMALLRMQHDIRTLVSCAPATARLVGHAPSSAVTPNQLYKELQTWVS